MMKVFKVCLLAIAIISCSVSNQLCKEDYLNKASLTAFPDEKDHKERGAILFQNILHARLYPDKKRKYDLYFDYPFTVEDIVTIELDKKIQLDSYKDQNYYNDFIGSFKTSLSQEKNNLIVTRSMKLFNEKIKNSDYMEFRELLKKISDANEEKLILTIQ